MSEISILAKAVKENPKRIRYLKSNEDKRIFIKKDGSIDLLKSVYLFALTPEIQTGFKKCKICDSFQLGF